MTYSFPAHEYKRGFKTGGYDALEDMAEGRPYDNEPPAPRQFSMRTEKWTEGYRAGYHAKWYEGGVQFDPELVSRLTKTVRAIETGEMKPIDMTGLSDEEFIRSLLGIDALDSFKKD